jgi:photosystem II stability/assembly factor-like uncharacterized protein
MLKHLIPRSPSEVGLERLSLAAITMFLLFTAVLAWPAAAADASVAVIWTHGACRRCETAKSLSDVQFVSPAQAWAIGYRPPGETGEGDYSIVHTRDGGKTWAELPGTYAHNLSPSLSFADRWSGWVMVEDVMEADQRLLQTQDGGASWRRLAIPDPYLEGVEYLGRGQGLVYSFDIYARRGRLWITEDGGRRWRKEPLPGAFDPERIAFTDLRRGILAGCRGGRVVIVRTTDAGRHWTTTEVDLPRAAGGTCDDWVDDLSLAPDGRGLLLIDKRVFASNDTVARVLVLRTRDGGASWSAAYRNTFAIPGADAATPGATGFLQAAPTYSVGRDLGGGATVLAKDDASLLVADGDGGPWRAVRLPRPLLACRPYAESLTCAAGGAGFWVARVTSGR